MSRPHHVLVETQGAWAGPNARRFLRDAVVLARAGEQVSVFLLQDGVLSAVADPNGEFEELAAMNVDVRADDFSLAQRALLDSTLVDPVRPAPIDWLAERVLADGHKVVWH